MTSPLPEDIQMFLDQLELIEDLIDTLERFKDIEARGGTLSAEQLRLKEAGERALRHARVVVAEVVTTEDGLKIAGRLGKAQKETVIRVLARLGLSGFGSAFGQTAAKVGTTIGRVCGGALRVLERLTTGVVGGVLEVLLNPTPTGGDWEEEIVDTMKVRIDGKCFEIQYVRGKHQDEALWSEVYSKTREIPCEELSSEAAAMN